jgi:hypothetical protein
MNPAVASAAANTASKAIQDPATRRTAIIIGVVVLAAVGFGIYKLMQFLGAATSEDDRLLEKWNMFLERWQALNPNYAGLNYSLGQSQLIKLTDELSDSFGLFDDDESRMYSALEQIGSAKNLSAVAKRYAFLHGYSLRDDLLYHFDTLEERRKMLSIFKNYPDYQESYRASNIQI